MKPLEATTLLTAYHTTRQTTERLMQPLATEDYIPQPVVDVSPPKWHLGHTTWFFENFVLVPHLPNYKLFDARFGFLFNSYYESVGQRVLRHHRGNLTRPTVAEVYAYRAHVDEHLQQLLQTATLSSDVEALITLGLQHEQQHQELFLTDFKYILSTNPLFPAYRDAEQSTAAPAREMGWLAVPEGVYEIGHQGPGFCFDNELSRHKVYLQPFELADRLITVGEYLEFMQAGGYSNFRPWLSEGWSWVQEHHVQAPSYWHREGETWKQFTLHGLQPLNENAPVTHLSYYEADAYASWRGLRLPTEFEWETALRIHQPEMPANAHFQESEEFHPAAAQPGNTQLWGDCWEWTASAYLPYPGYAQAEGAIGEYNGKFMINQMVLRGGSVATPRNHIRATYRNFFHAHLRWQFTGIRLAR